MSNVAKFNLSSLRSEEILGFCVEIAEKIKSVSAVAGSTPYLNFMEAIQGYSSALNAERGLHYNDLEAADDKVDCIISNMRMHLQALMNYPDENVRSAASTVWNAVEKYGSPTQLNFSEEYAIVIRMLEALEALDKSLLDKATVSAWVPALRMRYDAFIALMKSYDSERASIVPGTIKTFRQALFEAWQNLCDCISCFSIISPSAEIETLIAEMNTRIQSKKTALKSRKTARKNDDVNPSDETAMPSGIDKA